MKIQVDVFPPFKELIVGLLIHQAVIILACLNFARLENTWAPNFKNCNTKNLCLTAKS